MKVSPPAPFTVVKGALDSSGPVLRWMFGDEEISLSVMRMINILPRVDPSEIVGDDEINQLFLHAEISKPAQDYVLHFLCGLYPDALGIHSVSLKHKLETSGLLEVPAKYNGPSFETHRYPAITPLRIFYSIFIYFGFKLSDYSLKEAASSTYKQVCAPYHTWAVTTAVSAGMCALPTRDQLLLSLNETGTDESAENEMRRYIKASLPVIKYVDNLYTSNDNLYIKASLPVFWTVALYS